MKRQLVIIKRTSVILCQIALIAVFAFHNLFIILAQADNLQQEITNTAVSSPVSTNTAGTDPAFSWLSIPPEPKYLASSRSLVFLAGEMIFHGLVDASSCADNGLLSETTASPCGEAVAHNAVILWQNQFDSEILDSSIQARIPTFMLKNVIVQESQFWPASFPTVYGYPEVGLGHVTEMGADTLLRWDDDFYAGFCTTVYSSDTCKKPYIYLPRSQQITLRGAIMQGLDADCSGCLGGIDLLSARDSIYLIAKVLHANYNYVEWMLGNITSRQVSKSFEKTDLWRFSLTSYNAGPGCLRSAIYQTQKNGGELTWKDVSRNFDKGCEGAVDYVNAVTNVYLADPQALEIALVDNSKASHLVFASTGLVAPAQVSIASEQPLLSTPAPESTSTSLTQAENISVPSLPDEAVTPVSPSETAVPSTPPIPEIAPISSVSENQNTTEIVVKFNGLVPSFIEDAIINATGGQVEGQMDALDLVVIEIAPEKVPQVLEELQSNLLVEYAEPNYTLGVFYTPNDPGYVNQTYLTNMQIPEAWDISTGQGVIVAVIDTGVDVAHPDLASNIWMNTGETGLDANGNNKRSNGIDDDNNGYTDDWHGWNFVDASNNIIDTNGHGTHGAGIIAAQMDNGIGIAGIAPSAQIMSLKALDDTGFGTYAQVAEAIIYAVDNGAQVINLGFGGTANSEALLAAVDYAYSHNVTVVAAAGNTGTNTVFYPAAYTNVIAISALDNNQTVASFSTFNDFMDLAAPGVGIYSTIPNGGYSFKSGTSMSSAEVSGIAALLASQPQFDTASKIRNALVGNTQDLGLPGWDAYYGYGLVDVLSAITSNSFGILTPINTPPTTATINPNDMGGVKTMASQQLWATAQTCSYAITNPGNSIDLAANGQSATCAGTFAATLGNNWTLTTIQDTTLSTIASPVTLNIWFGATIGNDTLSLDVFDGTTWTTVATFNTATAFGLRSYDVSAILNTVVKVNAAQVRIISTVRQGAADNITITLDEVRIDVTDGIAPPTLTSPTATSILDTIATLGANITSNGGSALTARGTCWGTTAAPVTNCAAEGGTGIGVFTQARTGLPAGTLVYYRGYAINAAGTGYSPDGSFYTEPAIQASGVNFTAVSSNSFTVNWTRGSGNGVIILIKDSSAVDSNPVDGTYTGYVADAVFGNGTQLGTGNFVAYKGTGTSVAVTGLSPNTTYYVAIYEFAGTMDTVGDNQGTNYKFIPATGNQITVNGGNTPPTVSITVPSNGSSFVQGTNITFTGTATDTQDGNISANLNWTSSVDGVIGTGSSFSKSNLSIGTHTITASVIDSGGLGGSASITVTITLTNVAPFANNDYYNTPKNTVLTIAAPGVLTNDTDSNGDLLTAVSFTALNPPTAGALVTNANGSFTFTPAVGFTGSTMFTYRANDGSLNSNIATVYITVSTPHGPYGTMTDECGRCHRSHTANTGRLLNSSAVPAVSPLTDDGFCLSCHATDATKVSTHSNSAYASRVEAVFEVRCIQCHDPHGSTNWFNIRPSVIVRYTPSLVTTGPVTFTALTGTNSFDDGTSATTNRICVTCHVNTNNLGYPMASHTGGALHNGGNNYSGQDCTTCHPHSADSDPSTKDGFMPSGGSCKGCHSTVRGTRRQIVGTGGDFVRTSHHVAGADAVTDADCEICHDQSTHMGGTVRLKNADTPVTIYALDGISDAADYKNFCTSCHDANGKGGVLTPFSDGGTVININTTWTAASHNTKPVGTFTASCRDCHSNGHGSNKVKILSAQSVVNDWLKTSDGDDDPMNQEEQFCYICHGTAGPATPQIPTLINESVQANFGRTTRWVALPVGAGGLTTLNDRHDVQRSAQLISSAKIECVNCHNPHADNATLRVIANPDPTDARDPTVGSYFTGSDFWTNWCLDCHDNTYPTGVNAQIGLVNINGTMTDMHATGAAKATNLSVGTGYTAGMFVQCRKCHGFHVMAPTPVNNTRSNYFSVLTRVRNAADTADLPVSYLGTNLYELTDNSVNTGNVTGGYWCNTCHDRSAMETKANCYEACHQHGGGSAGW